MRFSVRDLLKLTLAVAVILTIGDMSRGSQYFGALASPWTAISLLPIAAVWLTHRWRLATPRAIVIGSMFCYVLALAVPALALDGDVMFGWFAWVWSFFGLDFFGDRHNDSFGWIFGPITIPLSYPIACTIGAAANLAYVISLAAYWFARSKPAALTLSHRAATLAAMLAVLVVIPLAASGELTTLYAGYGLWATSFLALALGTRRNITHLGNAEGRG